MHEKVGYRVTLCLEFMSPSHWQMFAYRRTRDKVTFCDRGRRDWTFARAGLQVIIGIACNVSNHIEPSAPANWRTIGPRGDWFIISSTIGKVGTSIGKVQA